MVTEWFILLLRSHLRHPKSVPLNEVFFFSSALVQNVTANEASFICCLQMERTVIVIESYSSSCIAQSSDRSIQLLEAVMPPKP